MSVFQLNVCVYECGDFVAASVMYVCVCLDFVISCAFVLEFMVSCFQCALTAYVCRSLFRYLYV